MPVFRVEKNSNYTTMCNYHLRDQGLSLKGKGLLSMLLSLPDTWNYSVRGLSSITPDGVDGVLTALKELERLGYLERNQQRESNGRMGRAEYVIYEMPRKKPCSESPCTEKPYAVNPDTDTPVTENPAQLSTNRTSTETINKREKKEIQHRYGSYENVLLSDTEYGKLRQEFPGDYQMRVERLSEYKPRIVRCPYCRHNSIIVFEDTRGHVQTKCKACGRETVFNVLEMRRLRRLQLYYSSLNG